MKTLNHIDTLEKIAKSSIYENGIFPCPAIIVKEGNNIINIIANAIPPQVIINNALIQSQLKDVIELIFSIDCYTKPNQGTELDSALVIFHCKVNQPALLGIMEYSYNNGSSITKPINWENKFWINAYQGIINKLTELMKRL